MPYTLFSIWFASVVGISSFPFRTKVAAIPDDATATDLPVPPGASEMYTPEFGKLEFVHYSWFIVMYSVYIV